MGRQLRSYDVQDQIGRGGMAMVYRAVHTELERTVAIKELQPSYRSDDEMVERFKREAKAVAALMHQNIVQIYDFWCNKNGYYLVMEYVDGMDLRQVLDRCGYFPTPVFAAIGLLICDALSYAHSKGIIHRDVKLSNVLISKTGQVKLTDFGIAQLLDSKDLTPSGVMLGTPAYMSPEQIQGEPLGPASDIFSLGVVFYEMLTGKKPFSDPTDTRVILDILKAKPLPPRRHAARIPRSLQRVVLKCLRKKPTRRFPAMEDLRKSLARYCVPRSGDPGAIIRGFLEDLAAGKTPPADLLPKASFMPIFIKLLIALSVMTLGFIPAFFYYLNRLPHSVP